MNLLKTGKLICPSLLSLTVICFRHVLSNGLNEEHLPVSTSEVYKNLKNSPMIRGLLTSNRNQKGIQIERRLFSNLPIDDTEHDHEEANEFGIIYDYALPKRYKFKEGGNKYLSDDENGILSASETEKEECEIKYFYDIEYEFVLCRLVGNDCYLEYKEEFMTVIPDKNRCLQKNNSCVLIISENGVMLPFTRLKCSKYRIKARTLSDVPFPELEKKNECEFSYINEFDPQELFCQLKENDCYLGNEEKITIIRDDENCRLVRHHCVSKGDMRTELPFVYKDCHKFDIPHNLRYKRQLYPENGCELYYSQNMFYRIVKCQLIYGQCYLEIDDRVTIQPDNENCFQHGEGCYTFTLFPRTKLPLVDKDCIWRNNIIEQYPKKNGDFLQGLSLRLGTAKKKLINSLPKLAGRVGDVERTNELVTNGIGLNGVTFGRSSINVPPNPVKKRLIDGLPNAKVQRSRWKDKLSEDDIWKYSQYTGCILLMQKKDDKFEKRCYPGNHKTEFLIFDNERNCRLINGECNKVHKNREVLRKYFSLSQKKKLRRIKLTDECYVLDGENLYEIDCSESNNELLMVDPENPKNFCDSLDCGQTKKKTVVPIETVNSDSASILLNALKAIVPDDQFQIKPDGLFYSVAFLYNDSFSEAISTPEVQQPESNQYNQYTNYEGREIEHSDLDDYLYDEAITTPSVQQPESNQYDQYINYEERKIEHLDLDYYLYDDSEDSGAFSEEKSRQSSHSKDAWQDPRYTNCIFHLMKGKNSWKAKCYPGNDLTDEINPQLENSCHLIDGECLKVHRYPPFLSSYFRESPNEILKCIKLDDECFLVSSNSLLENIDDCYESMCNNLTADPRFHGNYCESPDCGHSRNNLKFLRELNENDDKYSSDWPQLQSLKDMRITWPLLHALKAVVPKANFDEKPSALLFSIGLLYNSSRSSDASTKTVEDIEELAGRSNRKVIRKVGNATFDVGKKAETPEDLLTKHLNLTGHFNTQDISQRLGKNEKGFDENHSFSSEEYESSSEENHSRLK